jgi:predicted MFS family arabinose efflux permease
VVVTVLGHTAFVGSRMALSLYAIKLGASPFTVGLLIALYSLVPMLIALPAGRAIDNVGAFRPLAWSAIAMLFAVALPFFWHSLVALHIAATLVGTSFLFYHMALNAAVGALGGPEDRAVNFSWLAIGFSISGFGGPILAGFAIDATSHGTALLLLSLLPVAALVPLQLWRKTFPRVERVRTPPGERHVMDLLRNPTLRRAFIASLILSMGWDLYTFLMPVYGTRIGLSASEIGVIMGFFAAATFAIRLAMPAFSRRVQEWSVIMAAMLVAGLAYLLFPLATNGTLLMAISFLLGLGLGASQPMIMALLYASSPPGRQGEVIGVRTTFLNASHTALPLVMGALGTVLGMTPVFWVMAAFLLGGGWYARRQRKTA